jgi:chromosome segregation ATPase
MSPSQSTWESLLINRKAMDYFLKMLIVLEGMISLTSENASNEDLAEICARIVPLAGSTLSSNITTQWQEECKISDDIILDLLPVVNYDTGERELKKFDRFFESESQEKTSGKVALCLDTISKMSQYTTDSTLKLNSYLVDVLKDWSKAKGVFFDLDARIESEREKLRKQLEVRMNALARDVTKINKLYENALDKITKLETKVKELVRVEAELAICTTKLEEAEYNADVKTAQMEELRIATSTAQAQLARSNSIIFAHEGELTQLNVLLSKTQTSLEVSQQKAAILDADLTKMTTEKLHFEAQYNQLVEKEESRKKNQVTQSTQADPAVASIAIQTEFLVPPVSSVCLF